MKKIHGKPRTYTPVQEFPRPANGPGVARVSHLESGDDLVVLKGIQAIISRQIVRSERCGMVLRFEVKNAESEGGGPNRKVGQLRPINGRDCPTPIWAG